ncbi:hypothetical protein [Campylobacter sp. MIT 97-5078]|uniref:hypothetical protein n=1 Tax=Campylobacter sp. MIT 97-5078 TaxID=1548153 RepID=UPI00068A0ECD|nr:hypothetical protein [Campylobacter sp. MIT 97-5078]TQR27388.1 hypothetical protein DMB91_03780 [Campylobacter sp. MIT 97-5078]
MNKENDINETFFNHKIQNTICSVQELRLPIFAPIKRTSPSSAIYKDFLANKRTRSVQTKWGKVQIKGFLLTQAHKDLLDLIIFCAKYKKITNDNRLLVEFSTANVLKYYGDKGFNYKWFKSMLDEIMSAVIYLKTNDGIGYAFHIISTMKYNDKEEFLGIFLSSEYLKFYKDTFAINYNKETLNIVNVENSTIKTAIRFFISHNALNLSFDNLLLAIGVKANKGDRYYRAIKQEFNKNIHLLAEFNIVFKNDTFTYKGNDNVSFFLN